MSESIEKIISIGAVAVIAALIVAFGFSIVQGQKANAQKAIGNVDSMNATLDEAAITDYDGREVTGSQVLSAISSLRDQHIQITVLPKIGGTANTFYIPSTLSGDALDTANKQYATALSKVKQKTNAGYITPSAKYNGMVYRNKSNQITDLVFTVSGGAEPTVTPETSLGTAAVIKVAGAVVS